MGVVILLITAGFSVFVGALIGAVGIGGVLLVPFLSHVAKLDVHISITAAMFGYVFAGATGAALYARAGSIRWAMVGWLVLGAMPAAFLGAATVSAASTQVLEVAITGLLLFAGVNALRATRESAERPDRLAPTALLLIGAVTGFGSAMTGTGGPLILVPLLVWLRIPVLAAVGLSQATQFPIASMATVGNFLYGDIDFLVGGVVAAALVAGVAIGAKLAHAIRPKTLARVVAFIIIAVGLFMSARLILAALSDL